MRETWWIGLVMIVAGQLTWLLSAEKAIKWLVENDPGFEPPGMASRLFIGRLLTSFGPMVRYGKLSQEKGVSSSLVPMFWGGFAFSLLGVVVLIALI